MAIKTYTFTSSQRVGPGHVRWLHLDGDVNEDWFSFHGEIVGAQVTVNLPDEVFAYDFEIEVVWRDGRSRAAYPLDLPNKCESKGFKGVGSYMGDFQMSVKAKRRPGSGGASMSEWYSAFNQMWVHIDIDETDLSLLGGWDDDPLSMERVRV